ncbi:hypothetical protein [Nonomuraea sp. SYSU D8015]|uniref:hypothetical protein n=1 Tax=Nonomuraea sp. SYSU D8015 TaxID=2593644 RepID=UPI00166078E4|nr:hypothetical protein [Nonomuraea sp. SYSU D8015]
MSGSDDKDGGGSVVQFPRVFLPGSFDAPRPDPDPGVTDSPAEGAAPSAPAGVWPRLPGVADMAPPLALTMPGVPAPADAGEDSGEDGGFVPPAPEDPDNPTVRDTLAVAIALVTALGVAAAQGMWQQARRRKALADEARANADKAQAKAAASGARRANGADSGGSGGKRSSLRSPGGGDRRGSRPDGGRKRRDRGDRPGAGQDRSRKGPGRDSKGGNAPQAGPGGKTTWGRDKQKRRKGAAKGGFGWRKRRGADTGKSPKTPKGGADKNSPKAPKAPKKPAGKLRWKAPKRRGKGGDKDPKGWTSGRPGGGRKRKADNKGKPRHDRLRWKASKRRPGPGGDKAIEGRKRWNRRVAPEREAARPRRRSRKSWVRKSAKHGARWLKRWSRRRTRPEPRSRMSFGFTWPKRGKHRGARQRWWTRRHKASGATAWSSTAGGTPPPPPPGFEGMRPPPGADRSVRVESCERVDDPPEPAPEPLVLAGAPAGGRPALPAGPSPTPAATPNGARFVSAPVRSTQYRDAELTIYDVIDADADMAEEILDGVAPARHTADGCELLLTRLESLHAKVVELMVPGVLEGMVVRLMDKTATVRARAMAIADTLPAASEAISIAGANAAARHKPLADAVRDAGHTRPAEREYHDE